MPSLCSNIIRGKEISEKKLISPPIIEKIYEKKIKEVEEVNGSSDIDINDIYKKAEKEAEKKGEEIVESYRSRAEEILSSAREEIKVIKENANEEGYQAGYKTGYKEGYSYGIDEAKKEYENLINEAEITRNKAKEYLENCYSESRQYISDVKEEIINIIVEVSRKVIAAELQQNKEAVSSILESAILRCADKNQIILKLSAKNAEVAKVEKSRFLSIVDENCNILIITDGEIDDYTFKLETPSGFVDASVETQLQSILKTLLGDSLQCIT